MSTSQAIRKYLPEKLNHLINVDNQAQQIQLELDVLGESVFLDIIDGWSTGDELVDFALVASNGTYDDFVINSLYRGVHEVGLRKPGSRILVIQHAECIVEDELFILRNLHLGALRCAAVELNTNEQLLGIPIETKYLEWREFLYFQVDGNGESDENEWGLLSAWNIKEDSFITVGPLENDYCPMGRAKNDSSGVCFTPQENPCIVVELDDCDKNWLRYEHGIDSFLLEELHRQWLYGKNK